MSSQNVDKYIMISILIILTLIIIILLIKKKEHYFPIQSYPYLPPRHWKNRSYSQWNPHWFYGSIYQTPKYVNLWNPLWDSDNEYHPAVPSIVNYEPNSYKLPIKK